MRGTYNTSDGNPSAQSFPLIKKSTPKSVKAALEDFDSNVDRPVQWVSMRILNNYGHENYTCLYRLMVHGEPVFYEY